MKKIRILIVEDHEVVIKGIITLLEPYKELEIVGYALDSEEAMLKVEDLRPDIIIMDINLPEVSGIEITDIQKGSISGLFDGREVTLQP